MHDLCRARTFCTKCTNIRDLPRSEFYLAYYQYVISAEVERTFESLHPSANTLDLAKDFGENLLYTVLSAAKFAWVFFVNGLVRLGGWGNVGWA